MPLVRITQAPAAMHTQGKFPTTPVSPFLCLPALARLLAHAPVLTPVLLLLRKISALRSAYSHELLTSITTQTPITTHFAKQGIKANIVPAL